MSQAPATDERRAAPPSGPPKRAPKPRAVSVLEGIAPYQRVWLVGDGIDDVDFTGSHVLLEPAAQLEARAVVFALAELEPDVHRELERNGLIDRIGAAHVFETRELARDAFRPATA